MSALMNKLSASENTAGNKRISEMSRREEEKSLKGSFLSQSDMKDIKEILNMPSKNSFTMTQKK